MCAVVEPQIGAFSGGQLGSGWLLLIARSCRHPSLLKWAAASEAKPSVDGGGMMAGAAKVPFPFPHQTSALLPSEFAISTKPSASKITNHAARRAPGHGEYLAGGECPGARVDKDFNLLSLKRRQIYFAIAIEVACSKREYRQGRRRRSSRSDVSVAIVEEESCVSSAARSDQEIRRAIAIDINGKRRPKAWDGISCEIAKNSVMVVEEDIDSRLFGNNRHVWESIAIKIGKRDMIGRAARRI